MNHCVFSGRLTRDPEVTQLPSGSSVANFSIAVDGVPYTDKTTGEKKTKVDFLDCAAFGKTGETIASYFKKGDPIYIEDARAQQDTWETSDGERRSRIKFVVNRFEFALGKPKRDDTLAEDSEPEAPAPETKPAKSKPRKAKATSQEAVVDDIPF